MHDVKIVAPPQRPICIGEVASAIHALAGQAVGLVEMNLFFGIGFDWVSHGHAMVTTSPQPTAWS